MLRLKLQPAPSSSSRFNIVEMVLAIMWFAIGAWTLRMGWNNPSHVGWIPSGVLVMAGMIACAWLIWQRRKTQRSTVLTMLFIMQLAGIVEGILEWRANTGAAAWPTSHCVLATLLLALMLWEESAHRKQCARESAHESKLFDMGNSI